MDNLSKRLKASARQWATDITKLANKNLGKFKSLILVRSKSGEKSGKIEIISTATATNPEKPVSRAYEYGSGTKSRSKKKSKHQLPDGRILIRPRNKKVLAFYWQVASANPQNFSMTPDGKVLLPEVKHPGVSAANSGKGYLSPAIASVRRSIRKDIPKDIRQAVIGSFRKKFK